MKTFLSIIFLLSNICCVWSYSSGAPKSISVCSRRLPHHGVKPQDGEAPYVIKVNTTSPGYGDFIQVTIAVKGKTTSLKGFILQALPIDVNNSGPTDSRLIGTFRGEDIKLLNCFQDNDTVTHIDNSDKSSVKLIFRMVSTATYNRFNFRGTVVKGYTTFWTGVSSEIITPPDAGPSPSEEWTRTVIEAASSLSTGKTSWNKNIKDRLKLGYSRMIDSMGQLKTRHIFRHLPFLSRANIYNNTATNSLYRSQKKFNMLSSSSLTKEMLQGDINSAVYLAKKLNISKKNPKGNRL